MKAPENDNFLFLENLLSPIQSLKDKKISSADCPTGTSRAQKN